MDQNETEKQTIEIQPEPGRRPRRGIAAIAILCVVLLAGFGVFTSRLGQVPSDGNGHISSRVLSEKQWSRIFTENGEHRITHVYDFASTYGRLSFVVREYQSGKMRADTFVGAVDWDEDSEYREGSISLVLKPSTGTLKIEVHDGTDDSTICTFSADAYPLLEDMVLVFYRQLDSSAIEDGREILLLDYAWDEFGTYGTAQSDEDLKNMEHYVKVFCTFDAIDDGSVT
ncbi:MAG: hypothetical protein J5555_05905 [Firmicutes bacterium]|nr:hypothetical protein [Bacillota bacterium]